MSDEKNLPARNESKLPTSIPISSNTSIDLSWMPESQRAQLLTEYTRGALDIGRKAQELQVDVNVLRDTLGNLTETTRRVAADGNSVTITHTQSTSVGRTEVIMGNTDNARSGKLSKTQTGEKDWTPMYIIAGLIAVVLIVSSLAGS